MSVIHISIFEVTLIANMSFATSSESGWLFFFRIEKGETGPISPFTHGLNRSRNKRRAKRQYYRPPASYIVFTTAVSSKMTQSLYYRERNRDYTSFL